MGTTVFRDVLVYRAEAPEGCIGPTDVRVDDGLIGRGGGDAGARTRAAAEARTIDGRRPPPAAARADQRALPLAGQPPEGCVRRACRWSCSCSSSRPRASGCRPTPREAYVRTMLGALEMLRAGTTAVQDDAFLMPAPRRRRSIDAVMPAYADCGIRAAVALDQPELPESDKLPYMAEPCDGRGPRGARRAGAMPADGPAGDVRPPDLALARRGGRPADRGGVDLGAAAGERRVLRGHRRAQPAPRRCRSSPTCWRPRRSGPWPREQPALRRPLAGALHGRPRPAQRPHERDPRDLGGRGRPRPDRRVGRGDRPQPGQQPAAGQRGHAVPDGAPTAASRSASGSTRRSATTPSTCGAS